MTAVLVFIATLLAALLGIGYTYQGGRKRKQQEQDRLKQQGKEYQELLKKWKKK